MILVAIVASIVALCLSCFVLVLCLCLCVTLASIKKEFEEQKERDRKAEAFVRSAVRGVRMSNANEATDIM